MQIEVRVPESMRQYAGDKQAIEVAASTVGSALETLRNSRPDLYSCICDETGRVRRHIHVFVNSQFVPAQEPAGLDLPLTTEDVLTIWTAVSGG